MKGSSFICTVFILGVISFTSGQQSRLVRRLDSVERKIDAVLLDMMNFRTDIKDIHKTVSLNHSSPSCRCTGEDKTEEDKALEDNVDTVNPNIDTDHSYIDTIAANTDRILIIYKGFQDFKGTVKVTTTTHSNKIKGVDERLEEIEQKIEAIGRFNNQQVNKQVQVVNRLKSLESEINLLRLGKAETDNLQQLQDNLKADMEDNGDKHEQVLQRLTALESVMKMKVETDQLHQLVVNMDTKLEETIKATTRNILEQRLQNTGICAPGWYQYLNYCYYFSNTKAVSWHKAIQFCKTEHARLIEYDSKDEQNFVLRLVRSLYTWSSNEWNGFYIGGSDMDKEGKFVWESSQEHILNNNWLPGQPDNGGSYEHCMVDLVNRNGLWNDGGCQGHKTFVCKKKLLDV